MAKRPVEEEDEDRASDPNEDEDASASARSKEAETVDEDEESGDEESEDEESEDEESDEEEASSDDEAAKSEDDAAEGEPEGNELAARTSDEATDEEEDDDVLPTQLGSQRYVFAAFFLAALLGTYILARTFDAIWQNLVNRDAVVAQAPWLTSVTDDGKQTYSMIVAGVISLLYTVHAYRKESVQKWTEEVSSELVKVKWPTRKEVIASTTVVLATSAIAVVYLFLLDRFWGFVSNLIYGKGT